MKSKIDCMAESGDTPISLGGVGLGKRVPDAANEVLIPANEELEQGLISGFAETVHALDFSDLAVIPRGRSIPKSLGAFSLIPFMSNSPAPRTIMRARSDFDVPEGIRTTFSPKSPKPQLDAQLGIGLVKGDWLVALSAAGVEGEHVRIIQNQDVSGTATRRGPDARRERFKTGLHDGFLWADTLTHAWERIAADNPHATGVTMVSGKNSLYPLVRGASHHNAYDGVAERRGYTQVPSGNWIKRLGATAL